VVLKKLWYGSFDYNENSTSTTSEIKRKKCKSASRNPQAPSYAEMLRFNTLPKSMDDILHKSQPDLPFHALVDTEIA